ncbi:hypothetical protein HBH98_179920 [Parastagonospora nodorum]|nr:hypothetical protein HBH46_137400 [Parastagonospora nodorum]KAH4177089.1 hypothetical protein HBH43_047610 [Parastagonospora nodorum]KAH4241987.1 hypothetical protein HBI06_019770 [Parastagonospora nodorum]KAH4243133.1 hypothetical protein HBI05_079400 [Parastagonospora nodorum]KAH4341077.1 hypothetical protein HBH98_179920 [Parastagonospora nodorum]
MPISTITPPSPTSLHSTHIHFTKSSTWIPHTLFFLYIRQMPMRGDRYPHLFYTAAKNDLAATFKL